MPKMYMTRDIAYSAGMDVANRLMRAAGRTTRNEDDYNAAVCEFNRRCPVCPHGCEPPNCWLCIEADHPEPSQEELDALPESVKLYIAALEARMRASERKAHSNDDELRRKRYAYWNSRR